MKLNYQIIVTLLLTLLLVGSVSGLSLQPETITGNPFASTWNRYGNDIDYYRGTGGQEGYVYEVESTLNPTDSLFCSTDINYTFDQCIIEANRDGVAKSGVEIIGFASGGNNPEVQYLTNDTSINAHYLFLPSVNAGSGYGFIPNVEAVGSNDLNPWGAGWLQSYFFVNETTLYGQILGTIPLPVSIQGDVGKVEIINNETLIFLSKDNSTLTFTDTTGTILLTVATSSLTIIGNLEDMYTKNDTLYLVTATNLHSFTLQEDELELIPLPPNAPVITYTGTYSNPFADTWNEYGHSMEYYTFGIPQEEGYAYTREIVAYPQDTQRCHTDENFTLIGCTSDGIRDGVGTYGRRVMDTTPLSVQPSYLDIVKYIGMDYTKVVQSRYPSTSGSVTGNKVLNATAVAQADGYYPYGYHTMNDTTLQSGSTQNSKVDWNVTLPASVQGQIRIFDILRNQTIIGLSNDNQTLYFIDNEGTLLLEKTMSELFTPFTDTTSENIDEIYVKNDTLYLVTATEIFAFQVSPYFNIGGVYYSTEQCIPDDENPTSIYLCSETVFVETYYGFDLYCATNKTLCSGDCIQSYATDETYNITYTYGECTQDSTCAGQDTCSFETQRECTSATSSRRCGFYGDDNCLTWNDQPCLANQRCNEFGTCEEIDFTSYSTIIPQIDYFVNVKGSDELSTVTTDALGRYRVTSTLALYYQYFNAVTPEPSTTLHHALNCDYQETITTAIPEQQLSFGTNVFNFTTGSASTKTNLYLLPADNTNYSVAIGDYVNDFAQLYIERNNTLKSLLVCIGESSCETPLFTDVSSNSFDDLNNIKIELTINRQLLQVDYNIGVDREGGTVYYQSKPFDYVDTATSYNRVKIVTQNNLSSITESTITDLPLLPPYYTTVKGTYEQIYCGYTTTGCRTVRVYGQGLDVPLYNNYIDKEICIDSLSAVNNAQGGQNAIEGLSESPLWTRLLLLMLAYGFVALLFFVLVDGSEEQNKVMRGVGIAVMVLITIMGVSLGLIEGWILVIMIIIVALVTAIGFRRFIFGD